MWNSMNISISTLFPLILLILLNLIQQINCEAVNYDEILHEENEKLRLERQKTIRAHWNLESNITDYNEEQLTKASKKFDDFRKKQYETIRKYLTNEHKANMTRDQRRQFEHLGFLGFSILDENDGVEFKNVQIQMEKIYSSATIDLDDQKNLSLEPDLNHILQTSLNSTLLKDVWVKWRDATGKKIRKHFLDYVHLGNKAAEHLGFRTIDDIWMTEWESDQIKNSVERLMNDLMDLYRKLHAYVRYYLKKNYNDTQFPTDGTIPAHLLGNMWGQTWGNLLQLIPSMQFKPDLPSMDKDVNEKLKNWSVRQMFEMSEKFFYSLGMENMTKKFWEESIIEKRENVEMVCHASAWDMFEMHDFRIKQCTEKTLEDLVTVHHEMGHIQYYMNYENQPAIYREGANPGFHEAIGDLMSLSVVTPEHLAKVGLLDRNNIEKNLDDLNLNYQLRMAMEKIAFLPFAFVMDKWRWDIFNNQDLRDHMNRHWWELRLRYQGISPPVKRNEMDFDPGSKYHIPAGVEYVRYFVSHVLQFQFYKFLCSNITSTTNDNNRLYRCDFYENKSAGRKLIEMLRKGSSEPWETTLETFIGTSTMSLDALYEYFQPLNHTLTQFLNENQIPIGWNANVNDYFIEGDTSSGQSLATLSAINILAFTILLSSLILFHHTF